MKGWWAAWVALLSRQEAGTTLALFRIATALVVLYSLMSIAAAGLVEVLWVDEAYGGYRSLPTNRWVLRALGGANPSAIWALWSISFVGAVAMLAGLGGRGPIAALVLAYPPLATVNGDASGGYDLMIGTALFLLLLGRANATLSIDCRRSTGHWTSDELVMAWPRYIVVFQLVIIYTSTGLHKLSADWVPGGGQAALYWVFQDPTWNRYDIRELAATWYGVTQVATLVTWCWEVGTVAMLAVFYFRYTADRPGRVRAAFNRFDLRKPWALVGVGLHIGILILLEVGPFSWISLSYYLCLWSPDEIRSVLGRIKRRSM
jgi:hypothetical protein